MVSTKANAVQIQSLHIYEIRWQVKNEPHNNINYLNTKTHFIMLISLPKLVSPERTDENLPSNSTFISPKCSSILLLMSAKIKRKIKAKRQAFEMSLNPLDLLTQIQTSKLKDSLKS